MLRVKRSYKGLAFRVQDAGFRVMISDYRV